VKLFGALCLGGILTISAVAGPVTLFDNTSQTVTGQDSITTYDGTTQFDGNLVAGPLYDQFMSDGNATGDTLTSLQLNLIAGNPNDGGSVTVGLYSDSSGNPGSLVATLGTVSDLGLQQCNQDSGPGNPDACAVNPSTYPTGGLQQGTLVGLNGLSVNLNASTEYWIGLSQGPSGTSALWDYTDSGAGTGTAGQSFYNSLYGLTGDGAGPYIMQVNATDNAIVTSGTPEPTTFVLLGSSVLALGLFRRKTRKS
jgi:hypothetical protein